MRWLASFSLLLPFVCWAWYGCGEEPGSLSLTVSWAEGQAPDEPVWLLVRVEERADPLAAGQPLGGAGPERYQSGDKLKLVVTGVPNGDDRVAVVEARSGEDPGRPVLFYGVSEPFSIRPGEHTVVDTVLTMQAPEVGDDFTVELLFDGLPRDDVTAAVAGNATVRTRSRGAASIGLANDLMFMSNLTTYRIGSDQGITCSQEDDWDVCTIDGYDLLAGLPPALDRCLHSVHARFLDRHGYEIGRSFAPVGVCDCGHSCQTSGQCAYTGCDGKSCGEDGCGRSCGECPAGTLCQPNQRCAGPMVEVPAGTFWMGCAELDCPAEEKPQHELHLSAYEIDETEVTVAAYGLCVAAGSCNLAGFTSQDCTWDEPGKESHPINCVAWFEADAYCRWAGKRLCTEAEWEKAARGGCELHPDAQTCRDAAILYPWGDEEPDCDKAVFHFGGQGCGTGFYFPVGSKPAGASPYGALDMVGNVQEWVWDWYEELYYADSPSVDPQGPDFSDVRVTRGAAMYAYPYDMTCSERDHWDPYTHQHGFGMRCCRSLGQAR